MKYDFKERKDMERRKKKSYVLAGKKSRKEKEMEGENFHENHHFSFLPNWEEMRK